MPKRAIKGVIIGGGVVIVLAIGFFVAYAALSATPTLAKKVSAIEELLPEGARRYVVFENPRALLKLYRQSDLHTKAVDMGIEKDFFALPEIERFQKQTHGQFFQILGRRVLLANYSAGWVMVSQPGWTVRMAWRWALKSGELKNHHGVPYCKLKAGQLFCFIGKYFMFSTSEELLQSMIDHAHLGTGKGETAETFRPKRPLIYGRLLQGNQFFTFDKLDYYLTRAKTGSVFKIQIDNLGGSIGSTLAGCVPSGDYSFVPINAVGFVNLARLEPAQVWQVARQFARSQNRPAFELEPTVERFFGKFSNEGFLIFSGFDTEKSFAPAMFVLGLKLKSPSLPEEWQAIAPWLLGIKPTQTVTYESLSVDLFELGENLPTFASTHCAGYFLLANSTDLLKMVIDTKTGKTSPVEDDGIFKPAQQVLNISRPAFYLNIPRLLAALKPYLSYAGDKSAYFSANDVDKRITPLLDGILTKAYMGQLSTQNRSLVAEIHTVPK